MKSRAPSAPLRCLLVLLCLLSTAVAFWTGLFTIAKWDDIWSGGDYISSYSVFQPLSTYEYYAEQVMELRQSEAWNGTLSYFDRERLSDLEKQLDPAATNFRYEVHSETGEPLSSNLPDGETMDGASAVQMSTPTLRQGQRLMEKDYAVYDDQSDRYDMMVYLGGPQKSFVRCDPTEAPGEYNAYGWCSTGEGWENYDANFDTRIQSTSLTLKYGVRYPFTVDDAFTESLQDYQTFQSYLPAAAAAALCSLCLALCLLFFFCRWAGRRADSPGVVLGWQDRIPLDLYLAVFWCLLAILLSAGDSITYSFNQGSGRLSVFVGLAIFTLFIVGLCLALLHTLAVRVKAGQLLRNTLLWRLCAALGGWVRTVIGNWPMTKRVVWGFLLYLLLTVLTGVTVVLIPVYQGFVLWRLCRWVRQWTAIREGTGRIVGGDPDFKIDAARMRPDLREHAEQLNDLGAAIGSAVDERMKSERFKGELITNVSHDLKTPLTSIINYVGLLKTTEIQDPKALEYIEVLERKSLRLKKLTEDLVEASKASTGVLTVSREKLGFTQLLTQALGEYEEKFEKSTLLPVFTSPDHELYVEADGRHLWRVIDNLLGNCVKYAMPGTRVYLDVKSWDGSVTLSVKNISREALNIPAEQLMERFVRGEESRSTEGSGLGLSIARSLTELQGGTFRIDIDGDLFKAVVIFPEYKEPLPLTEGRSEAG